MTNMAVLNNVDHHDLRVVLGQDAAFGDAVNQVLVFPTEFDEVQRHYPIVFRKGDNGRYHAVALLGLDLNENLFLEDGWRGRYVPAMQQRGPFLIGFEEREEDGETVRHTMIHVDLDHPRVSRTEGAALFLAHGGNAPFLDHVVRVLRVIHDGLGYNDAMFAAFEEFDLIEPVMLQITLEEGLRYDVPDCFAIGADRLARLDGVALGKLNRTGFLRTAFMALSSLANVSQLIELKNRKRRRLGGSPRGEAA